MKKGTEKKRYITHTFVRPEVFCEKPADEVECRSNVTFGPNMLYLSGIRLSIPVYVFMYVCMYSGGWAFLNIRTLI